SSTTSSTPRTVMMSIDLCQVGLAHALGTSFGRASLGALLGVGAVLGWGVAVEALFGRWFARASWAHAFVEGTVVVALLRLVGSVAGACNPSWGIAWAGIVTGSVAAPRFLRRRVAATSAESYWNLGIAVLALPVCFRLVAWPADIGDLTA